MLKTGVVLSANVLKVFLDPSLLLKKYSFLRALTVESVKELKIFKETNSNGLMQPAKDSIDLCAVRKSVFDADFDDCNTLTSALENLLATYPALFLPNETPESRKLIDEFNEIQLEKAKYLSDFYSFCGMKQLEYLQENLTKRNLQKAIKQLAALIQSEKRKFQDNAQSIMAMASQKFRLSNFIQIFEISKSQLIWFPRIFMGSSLY
jgi:hypothetical protein